MKKISLIFILISGLSLSLAYIILFEGKLTNFEIWWDKKTRNSPSIPFSPYKKYRKDSSLLYFKSANSIIFEDGHLFWKGSGAVAMPEITVDRHVLRIIIISGGFGYSKKTSAFVSGAGGDKFELGPVSVENGKIKHVAIKKSGPWNDTPLAYYANDEAPFSGTIEKKFNNNQLIEETQYLAGKIHGNINRYNEKGIQIFSKEYVRGKKHGTHIFWYPNPVDPDNYVSSSKTGEKYSSLWMEINEKAKKEFGKDYGGPKSNNWVVSKFKTLGGDFEVRLLEHWHENKKHGLFEGFDNKGNKTFKDEFKYGLRVKHKTFDKTK